MTARVSQAFDSTSGLRGSGIALAVLSGQGIDGKMPHISSPRALIARSGKPGGDLPAC